MAEHHSAFRRISDYFPEIDYRVADGKPELEEIYRAPLQGLSARGRRSTPIASERFTDDYDRMDNCWIFGVYANDRLASSVRMHVISQKIAQGPRA